MIGLSTLIEISRNLKDKLRGRRASRRTARLRWDSTHRGTYADGRRAWKRERLARKRSVAKARRRKTRLRQRVAATAR